MDHNALDQAIFAMDDAVGSLALEVTPVVHQDLVTRWSTLRGELLRAMSEPQQSDTCAAAFRNLTCVLPNNHNKISGTMGHQDPSGMTWFDMRGHD